MNNSVSKSRPADVAAETRFEQLKHTTDCFGRNLTIGYQVVNDAVSNIDRKLVQQVLQGAATHVLSLAFPVFSLVAVPLTNHYLKKSKTTVHPRSNTLTPHTQSKEQSTPPQLPPQQPPQ